MGVVFVLLKNNFLYSIIYAVNLKEHIFKNKEFQSFVFYFYLCTALAVKCIEMTEICSQ